jgi:SAM-dependent methyltransferase
MKDRFSTYSDQYRNFRPTYPPEILASILDAGCGRERAWDCATGTGQMAIQLAEYFDQVLATDISPSQLAEAFQHPKITYSLSAAERTSFPDHHIDLITVAQAAHWFEIETFYREAERVLRPNGILALIGYGLNTVSPPIDRLVREFYLQTLGPYWDPERRHVDAQLKTLPFPFREIPMPPFSSQLQWSLDAFIGYLSTWSAVKKYKASTNADPLPLLRESLAKFWEDDMPVTIPFFARVGIRGD